MKMVVEHMAGLARRWGLQAAWLVMVVILVVACLVRACADDKADVVSRGLTDSLQCITSPSLQRVDYTGFRVYFNPSWHMPACVTYEITRKEAQGNLPRAKHWIQDGRVAGCASSRDYVNSGYDRGHIAPAGDLRWSEKAMRQSFTMTNVCPQSHLLNEGGWGRLEEKVREWVNRDGRLIVIAGPVVAPSDTIAIGETRVRVPGAFYKIVLAHDARPMRVAAFVYPNRECDGHLNEYATTVRHIETLTGLNFLEALPQDEQDRLETTVNLNPWLN